MRCCSSDEGRPLAAGFWKQAANRFKRSTEQQRNEENIRREVAVINEVNDYRFDLDAKNQQFTNRTQAHEVAIEQMWENFAEGVEYHAALSGARMDRVRQGIGTDLSDVVPSNQSMQFG